MADIQDIFNQYLERAELALTDGKLKDAYTLCMKVLENDPENSRALELKRRIESTIENYNIHSVDEKLEALKPLWEKGEYDKIIKELTELYRYAPHYEKLESALAQAQAMYRGLYTNQESEKKTTYKSQLDQLFTEKKYIELIEAMQKNSRAAAQDTDVRNLHADYRRKIIQEKIQEKKSLFESEKYEDIVNFLYQLQEIDKNSELIIDLLRDYRKKLLDSQIDDKQEFILRASENAKTLYQVGKYEKAMQVAEEILHMDPKNVFANSIYKKAKSTFEDLLQNQTEDQIQKNMLTFTQDAQAKPGQLPDGFMKL